jgi:hypothetical protein
MNKIQKVGSLFIVALIGLAILACRGTAPAPAASPTPAATATPTAIPPTPTPSCWIVCDVDAEQFSYSISCEEGPTTQSGETQVQRTFDTNGLTKTMALINQTLAYSGSGNTYVITGTVEVDNATNQVSYAISAFGGKIGAGGSTCQEGELKGMEEVEESTPATPEPTDEPGVLRLKAPADALSAWKGYAGKYVLYVNKDSGIHSFADLDGRNLYVEIIDLGFEEVLGDTGAFTRAGGIEMPVMLQNNDIFKDQYLADKEAVAWVTPAITARFGFDTNPDLLRLEFEEGEEMAAAVTAKTAEPAATPTPEKPAEPELTATPAAGMVKLLVSHSPNPSRVKAGGASGNGYTCNYETSVIAVGGDVQIEGFQANFLVNNQWKPSPSNNGQPWSVDDFADWYSCPGGLIHEGQECSDPSNWTGQSTSAAKQVKWIYWGVTSSGEHVEGEAIVECVP